LLAVAAAIGSLWLFQERLIYPARHYSANQLQELPKELVVLRDPSNRASIMGFYRPPLDGGVPRTLWLTFGGNGDDALRWDGLLSGSVTRERGFLMVEYPGYGARAGSPSPETLLSGTEATVQALAQHLQTSVADLESRTSLIGYSIGSAAALQYAARHPVQRIILFAPFTTMLDMARLVVGSPLCYLLTHRYDNLASLQNILAHGKPSITVFHGSQDSFIPHSMGQAVAAHAPGSYFELVPGADHGDVAELAAPRLQELLDTP